MKIHHLKCHPEPFRAMKMGAKSHEFRAEDDRTFDVGDVLVLNEFDPEPEKGFTVQRLLRRVTYLSRGPEWGIPIGFVAMSTVAYHDEDK